jgi:DtxR family Mn-dependent transcriptional regulator
MEDYLKTIYHLLSENGKANTLDLARLLKVSPPTVTQMVKKLADAKLVSYSPYRGFLLTDLGERIALEVIRHHRLVEMYLHEALGVPWDKVHEEAERWEHVISEDVEKRMDRALNYPKHDPHGSPIPNEQLVMEVEELVPLGELGVGESGVLREVPDEDADFLNYLDGLNLFPNTVFEVEGNRPFEGTVSLLVSGKRVTVDFEAAMRIRVRRISTKG